MTISFNTFKQANNNILIYINTLIILMSVNNLYSQENGINSNEYIYFYFENGGLIEVTCMDWTDKATNEQNFVDNLSIRLFTDD